MSQLQSANSAIQHYQQPLNNCQTAARYSWSHDSVLHQIMAGIMSALSLHAILSHPATIKLNLSTTSDRHVHIIIAPNRISILELTLFHPALRRPKCEKLCCSHILLTWREWPCGALEIGCLDHSTKYAVKSFELLILSVTEYDIMNRLLTQDSNKLFLTNLPSS